MRRSHLGVPISFLVCAFVLAGLLPAMAAAQTELTGQTSGGAHYKIVVPDGWTPAGGLVIWNHGFTLSPVGPVEDLGPLAGLQLNEGYAVAASSYSLNGWALFETVANNEEMVRAFEAAFGVPDQVLVTGASLGGIVTAQALEQADLGNVVGAMPICGAMAGSRLWDGAVDLRLIYDAVCGDVPGAFIPGGAQGLPFPPDPAFDQAALAGAVNACTGILSPGGPTPEQAVRLAQILAVTGLPVEFLLTDLAFGTFGLANLVYDPRKLNARMPFSNIGVDYGDPVINAAIERIEADGPARLFFENHYTPTGNVGNVKIVSIHTDKDGLVIVENQNEYASVVRPENLTVGIVVEDVPSHCGFTEGEVVASWEALRGWVAGLPQPAARDLQATCEAIVAGNLAEGPCRFDPAFVVPDLDDRVRPRNFPASVCTPGPTTLCLNGNRFQVEAWWENFQGDMGQAQTLALPNDDSGGFWFFRRDNIELVVKALDGRERNDHFWVFYGSLSNVEFELTVTDTATGAQKTYENPSGNFASVGDTQAFDGD